MKRLLGGVLVGILGFAAVGMAVASVDEEEQALALIDQGKTGVEEAGFSCGAYCDGVWKHVNTCYGNQTCCGYIYCSSGVSQGTCCNTGQHCSWNGTGKPGAIYCINNS